MRIISPENMRRDAAKGPPFRGPAVEKFHVRFRAPAPGGTIGAQERYIPRRPDIDTAFAEQEIDRGGPGADALDFLQRKRCGVIVKLAQLAFIDFAGRPGLGERRHIARFRR